MEFGVSDDDRLALTFVNSGSKDVLVRRIALVSVEYDDPSNKASLNAWVKFEEVVRQSGLATTGVLEFPGSHVNVSNTGAMEVLFNPTKLSAEQRADGFIVIPAGNIRQMTVDFAAGGFDRSARNAVASGLLIDLLRDDGSVLRKNLSGVLKHSRSSWQWPRAGVRAHEPPPIDRLAGGD